METTNKCCVENNCTENDDLAIGKHKCYSETLGMVCIQRFADIRGV
jgi:hypothetical protein